MTNSLSGDIFLIISILNWHTFSLSLIGQNTNMKNLVLLLGLVFTTTVFAKPGDSDNIVTALKQGNANQFASYFDSFLDIKFPEKDELKNIGKTQATITVKSFFEEAKISGFELSSQRENEGTMYLTGKLLGGSKTYSLTLLMKSRGDKLSIIKIRIN